MPATPPRRLLLDALPTLARVYGILPWDLDRMTGDEIRVFAADLEQQSRAEQRARAQARRIRRRRGGR